MLGMKVEPAAHMTIRERLDFTIIILIFGILVATLAFSTNVQLSSMLISFSVRTLLPSYPPRFS